MENKVQSEDSNKDPLCRFKDCIGSSTSYTLLGMREGGRIKHDTRRRITIDQKKVKELHVGIWVL